MGERKKKRRPRSRSSKSRRRRLDEPRQRRRRRMQVVVVVGFGRAAPPALPLGPLADLTPTLALRHAAVESIAKRKEDLK